MKQKKHHTPPMVDVPARVVLDPPGLSKVFPCELTVRGRPQRTDAPKRGGVVVGFIEKHLTVISYVVQTIFAVSGAFLLNNGLNRLVYPTFYASVDEQGRWPTLTKREQAERIAAVRTAGAILLSVGLVCLIIVVLILALRGWFQRRYAEHFACDCLPK